MPEIPDLEAIRGYLNQRLPGQRIERAEALIPVVFRIPKQDFVSILEGNSFGEATRRGKFLLFELASGHRLVINAMLTGRFQYCSPKEKRRAKTCMVLALGDGHELRYSDERLMGKVYLVDEKGLAQVPQFAEMGPDALSPELTEEVFAQRLRRHNGQIKGILVNHKFVAGIGNAYADEILFAAGVHPYRKRPSLSDDEISRLYRAIRSVLADWAIPIVAERTKDGLTYEEIRDFLKVHRRGGEPCPNDPTHTLTEITAGGRITSFCRHCQH
jgi:formamidopyrimidine-DNA glycosylase